MAIMRRHQRRAAISMKTRCIQTRAALKSEKASFRVNPPGAVTRFEFEMSFFRVDFFHSPLSRLQSHSPSSFRSIRVITTRKVRTLFSRLVQLATAKNTRKFSQMSTNITQVTHAPSTTRIYSTACRRSTLRHRIRRAAI